MSILVTGATGLIGSALVAALRRAGLRVRRAVRRDPAGPDDVRWDARSGFRDAAPEGLTAAVHLAGAPLSGPRWTPERKRVLRESRVDGTRRLSAALARLEPRPAVLVSASAVGIYGDRGDEVLTEASAPGTGFLAGLAEEWEAATDEAAAAGIRVVHLRTGIVLSPRGGILARLLPPFRLGLGGPFGDPRAWISWIALHDHLRVIRHALDTPGLAGAVNATAPGAVRNADFARALGRALGRPAVLPLPGFVLSLVLGRERAREMVLAGARVRPAALAASGFGFESETLAAALERELSGAGS